MSEKLIDTAKIWLDVKTVAELKGVTARAIRIAVRKQKYIFRTQDIRGGSASSFSNTEKISQGNK